MDLISGVANISQLLHTGCSVTKSLIKLYKTIQTGPAEFHDQQFNVRLLLSITEAISKRASSKDESILQLFVQITDSVHTIINLLEQRGIFGINWILYTKSETIAAAFESLSRKRDLLHLHISHEGLKILHQIQKNMAPSNNFVDLRYREEHHATEASNSRALIPYEGNAKRSEEQNNSKDQGSSNEQMPSSNNKNEMKFDVQRNHSGTGKGPADQNILCGWGGPRTSVDAKVHDNRAADHSTQNIGNW